MNCNSPIITGGSKVLIKQFKRTYLGRSCKMPQGKISVLAGKVACSRALRQESSTHSGVDPSSVGRRASSRRGGSRCDPSQFLRTCRAPCDRSEPNVSRLPRRVRTPPGTSPYRSSRHHTQLLRSATVLTNNSTHSNRDMISL